MFSLIRTASRLSRKATRPAAQLQNKFTMQSARSMSMFVQHRDTPENNAETPFEFNAENKKEIEKILKKFPKKYKASATMPMLYLAQEQNENWIPISAMNKIAEILDIAPIRVYETATFYTMYNRTPVGKYHIQLCGTTPCQLRGSEEIQKTIEDELNIKTGETTKDGLFTLHEVECLGACACAPMIQVNNHEFYEWLTPESMKQLLADWKAGKTPKHGNQNGTKTCEGPMGKTTLQDAKNLKPQHRDFDALLKEVADAKAAQA